MAGALWWCDSCETHNEAAAKRCVACGELPGAVVKPPMSKAPVASPANPAPPVDRAPPRVEAIPLPPPGTGAVHEATIPAGFGRRGRIFPAVAAALVALVVGFGVVVLSGSGDDEAQPTGVGTTPSTSATAQPSASQGEGEDEIVVASTAPPTTAVTTPLDPESAAATALNDQVTRDRSLIDSRAVDVWVPQLSSKKLHIVDREKGITYDTYQRILEDFRAIRSEVGDVLLLDSAAFSTFKEPGFYVTIAAQPFSSADEANHWCDAHLLGPNDCFAKFVSHTTPWGPELQEYRR